MTYNIPKNRGDNFLGVFHCKESYKTEMIELIMKKIHFKDFEDFLSDDKIKVINLHKERIPNELLKEILKEFRKQGWYCQAGTFYYARGPFDGIAFYKSAGISSDSLIHNVEL
jgi:hypothetical protein